MALGGSALDGGRIHLDMLHSWPLCDFVFLCTGRAFQLTTENCFSYSCRDSLGIPHLVEVVKDFRAVVIKL